MIRLPKKALDTLLCREGKARGPRKHPRPRVEHYTARVRCSHCGKWRTAWTGDREWYVCPDCGGRGCRAVNIEMPHIE